MGKGHGVHEIILKRGFDGRFYAFNAVDDSFDRCAGTAIKQYNAGTNTVCLPPIVTLRSGLRACWIYWAGADA